jgi:hypothetical protein
MITRKTASFIAAGLCILGLSVFANPKHPVEHSQNSIGQFHVVIQADGSYVADGYGTGALVGKFHSHLEGGTTLGPSGPYPSSGFGFVEAANGDRFLIQLEPDSITIYDGPGRFEGATGHGIATTIGEPTVVFDPDTGTITMDAIETVEGTVTY